MLGRSNSAWKKATSVAQASIRREQKQAACPVSTPSSHRRCLSSGENGCKINGATPRSSYPSPAEVKHKREQDREFLISVLESTATKRDAKSYLQTFGSNPKKPVARPDEIRAVSETPRFVQGPAKETVAEPDEAPHVAIVKLRDPQAWDDALVNGVAKTLTQLRDLGLLSIIVLDCTTAGSKQTVAEQTDRILRAIGRHGSPGAEVVDSGIWDAKRAPHELSTVTPASLFVGFDRAFTSALKHGHILVVPSRAYSDETQAFRESDPNEVVLALTSYFSGLQVTHKRSGDDQPVDNVEGRPLRKALVDRIIVIDPLGGIPAAREKDGARVFVNLEEEFGRVQDALGIDGGITPNIPQTRNTHLENLRLVRSALAILPPTASAVITSPIEAANLRVPQVYAQLPAADRVTGQVGTRTWQNPLIHNLLTDRPIYSSSLPIGRIKPAAHGELAVPRMPTTTLAKKGLPVTIFPDPRAVPWLPPTPGTPRLRLTDTCINLPRLIHLINDSFSRKLDAEHYLRRLEDSLAGIIIAGEYEGGAILTWERPFGMTEEAAYNAGRLVPYLDKFAVLKKSQGAGGVADIVFNAMVRDCFPGGVCWRSRKNNPVNKWYFERSAGVRKLPDSNWAMFWTNSDAPLDETLMRDYEDVCRNVEPSWADAKQAD